MGSQRGEVTPGRSMGAAVDAFLRQAGAVASPRPEGRGRLIFGMDATMSRQPTWDLAMALQARMFTETEALGGLDVQLVYFRGHAECRASRFVSGGAGLARAMSGVTVAGGRTQLGRMIGHVRDEARRNRVGAFVFVGDALEERVDPICALAGEVALLGVRAFVFQEGRDERAGGAFREIARLTGGAYAAFDAASPKRLADLLAAAAVYAAGGRAALERHALEGGDAQKLLSQLSSA